MADAMARLLLVPAVLLFCLSCAALVSSGEAVTVVHLGRGGGAWRATWLVAIENANVVVARQVVSPVRAGRLTVSARTLNGVEVSDAAGEIAEKRLASPSGFYGLRVWKYDYGWYAGPPATVGPVGAGMVFRMRSLAASLPPWVMMPGAGLMALPAVMRHLRLRHRLLNGLCPHCGAELEALPERCPECGRGT